MSILLFSTKGEKKEPVTALKVSSDAFLFVYVYLFFFAHIVGVSQGHFPIIVQAKVRKDLWTMQSRTKKVHKLFTKLFLEKC